MLWILLQPRSPACMNDKSVYVIGNQIELLMLIHVSRVRSHVVLLTKK
jgi:hypothetical protein